MTFPGAGGPFDGPLGDLFGGASRPSGRTAAFSKKEEKGVPWEAKVIDGKYYIPLSQVADLLEANDILPKVKAGIRRRVEKGPPEPVKKAGHENMNDPMTLKVVQICDKCKKERTLDAVSTGGGQATVNHQVGGWRPFEKKHVCPDCMNAFIEELG